MHSMMVNAPAAHAQSAIRSTIVAGSEFNFAYVVMNSLVTVIACYGLLSNSPAVVIAAMISRATRPATTDRNRRVAARRARSRSGAALSPSANRDARQTAAKQEERGRLRNRCLSDLSLAAGQTPTDWSVEYRCRRGRVVG